jgi:EpsI family protein
MTIKRLLTLESVLLLGLGSVFLLPKQIEIQPAAIDLSLPTFVGDWYGADQPIMQGERDILGPDTQFVRKLYTNARGDQIFVSIVFSGPDMATSIHRPERCLPAQGWTIADSRVAEIPIGDKILKATRLHDVRSFRNGNGRPISIYSLDYYWFVGHDATTPSHYQRTWIDIRDRVLKGENQQWAYVTVISNITKGLQPFGKSEEETDKMLKRFVGELVPQLQQRAVAENPRF